MYLLLAAKVTKLPQGFKHWFALSCWTSLPLLLSTVVAAIFLIMSDTSQMSPSVMAAVVAQRARVPPAHGQPGYALFESLTHPGSA